MLVRYSIVELLMVFEVSAQREHTIVQQHLIKISYSDLTEATTWLYGSSNL